MRTRGGRSGRQYMLWAFKIRGCMDCGRRPQSREELADFDCDHREPETKQARNSYGMLANASLSAASSTMDALLDELMKCDPVCSDCHKVRTRHRLRPTAQVTPEMRAWMQKPVPWIVGEQESLFREGPQ